MTDFGLSRALLETGHRGEQITGLAEDDWAEALRMTSRDGGCRGRACRGSLLQACRDNSVVAIVENPKRSVSKVGGPCRSVLFGGRAGTDSPWEMALGVGSLQDEMTAVVFVRLLVFTMS